MIDPYTREVRESGRQVDLTRKEWELLCILAAEPRRVFTYRELKLQMWGVEIQGRTLDSHAHRLRKKLGQKYIVSVWGVGYRLMDLSEWTVKLGREFVIREIAEYRVPAQSAREAEELFDQIRARAAATGNVRFIGTVDRRVVEAKP